MHSSADTSRASSRATASANQIADFLQAPSAMKRRARLLAALDRRGSRSLTIGRPGDSKGWRDVGVAAAGDVRLPGVLTRACSDETANQ
jgi:hypothetical protein